MEHKLDDYNITQLYKSEKDPQQKERLLGLQHYQDGKKQNWIAEATKKTRQTVSAWKKRFVENGIDGLKRKPGQGRKSKLAKDRYEEFKSELDAMQKNLGGGRVRAKEIQTLLREKFDAEYKENSIYTLLKNLGIVWITARSIHPKANLEAQEKFKKRISRKST